jgi:subtilisin family serine protease
LQQTAATTAMKQTTKILIHSFSRFLLFSGFIFVAGSLHSPAHIPTPASPITHPHQQTPVNSQKNTHSVRLVSANAQSKPPRQISLSPKYDEIKESVQKEIAYHMFTTPNDPSYGGDWALAKINAPAAWNIATGNGQTVVAVIDGGFALNHEDLVDHWSTNPGETGTTQLGNRCWTGLPQSKQTNNCDDDDNGYVDDWRGWSFINGDNDPQAGRVDSSGEGVRHASEVSGLIGSSGNNGIGIVSLNWNTKIMPLQALDDDGTGYTSDVTAAVYYAVDNGAQVINLSLGAYANDPAMQTAVNYATAHNVVVVAAAGNCGDGAGSECADVPIGTIAYPAAYPNAIAVGASTQTDQRASFGSYGPALDVSAPGYNIPISTSWSVDSPTNTYASGLYGTSFSSPFVASLAALIKSIRPATSVSDVTALIDATATKPVGMNGLAYSEQFGHGIINAASALTIASVLNSTTGTPALLQAGSEKSEHTVSASSTLGSGCVVPAGNACTIQMTSSLGHVRFLPYSIVSASGAAGWTWSSAILDSSNWEIRARSGSNVSTTPYLLLKK